MNENVQQFVEERLKVMRSIAEEAANRIEAIKPGETVPATTMAEEIGKSRGLSGEKVYPLLKFLTAGYPGVIAKKGRQGGYHRLLPGEKATSEE